MKIEKAGFEILSKVDGVQVLKSLEAAGRTCYKSEDKITNDSSILFVKKLIERGHEAMIEHYSITVKVICDRGVSHEIVRHRLASYAQESTRYCNYGKDKFGNQVTFIQPGWFTQDLSGYDSEQLESIIIGMSVGTINGHPEGTWLRAMEIAECYYLQLLDAGWKPEQARSVLPNSLKTEIVITMNLREWRHFFKLRSAPAAHPQMREIAMPLLKSFKNMIPIIFDDIKAGDDCEV